MVRDERAAGFSIELLREAAETVGLNLEYHFDSWDRLLELMAAALGKPFVERELLSTLASLGAARIGPERGFEAPA